MRGQGEEKINSTLPSFKGGSNFSLPANKVSSEKLVNALKGLTFASVNILNDNSELDRFKANLKLEIRNGKYKNIGLFEPDINFLNQNNYKAFDILVKSKQIRSDLNRFDRSDIIKILSVIDENNILYLSKLLSAKDLQKNYRFNSSDIAEIMPHLKLEYKARLIDSLLYSRHFVDKKLKLTFNAPEIADLLSCVNEHNFKISKLVFVSKSREKTLVRFTDIKVIKEILSTVDNSKIEDFGVLIGSKNPANYNKEYTNAQVAVLTKLLKYNLPFKKMLNETSLGALSIQDKLLSLRFFKSACGRGASDFSVDQEIFTELKNAKLNLPLLPTSRNNIISHLYEIAENLFNSKTHYLNKETIENGFNALLDLETSLKNYDLIKYSNTGLPVEYSVEKFIADVKKAISTLNIHDRKRALDYYGINIHKNKLLDIPLLGNDREDKLSIINSAVNKQALLDSIQIIKGHVKHLILNNKIIMPDNKELSDDLTEIIKAFPEFILSIGRKQSAPHAYTTDIHMLKTLQEFQKYSAGRSLSSDDKKIARLAVLFHDIAKEELMYDRNHPENSSMIVHKMLKRVNLSDKEIERTCNLIRNHHWVERLENNLKNVEDSAFDFRRSTDYRIAVLFAIADLKAVGDNFYEKYKDKYKKYISDTKLKIFQIHKNSIYLPQTKIPATRDIDKSYLRSLGTGLFETSNVVIDIDKVKDFEKLGFSKGTTRENFYSIIHAIPASTDNSTTDFSFASWEGHNGVFSASYTTPDTFSPYEKRKYGFILNVDPYNIGAAYFKNLGQHSKLGLKEYKKYLFSKESLRENHFRSHFAKTFKQFMAEKLNPAPEASSEIKNLDDVYINRFKKLAECQALTDINNPFDEEIIIKTIKHTLFNKPEKSLNQTDSQLQNEVIVYAPKIQAIFTTTDPELVPFLLRKYAEDNNMPVIKFTPVGNLNNK
ncbi:MAG: HD domain-containing protein [Cyanobacteriota bacterium]